MKWLFFTRIAFFILLTFTPFLMATWHGDTQANVTYSGQKHPENELDEDKVYERISKLEQDNSENSKSNSKSSGKSNNNKGNGNKESKSESISNGKEQKTNSDLPLVTKGIDVNKDLKISNTKISKQRARLYNLLKKDIPQAREDKSSNSSNKLSAKNDVDLKKNLSNGHVSIEQALHRLSKDDDNDDDDDEDDDDEKSNTKQAIKNIPGVNINFYFQKGESGSAASDYAIKLSTGGGNSDNTDDSDEKDSKKKSKKKKDKKPNKKGDSTKLKLLQKWLNLEDKGDHEHHADFDHHAVSSKAMEDFLYKQLISQLLDPLKQEDDPFVTIQKLGLSTFTQLLRITGLDHRLKNMNKNFTIFTPTDTAFRRLSTEHKFFLSDAEYMEKLLLFHFCPGRVYSNQFKLRRNMITMYKGGLINLKTSFNTQTMLSITSIQSSNVMGADIISNGSVIHVIDKVLFYPTKTVLETIETDHRFKLFSYFLKNTTLRPLLANENLTFTVFVPKDSVILTHGYFLFYKNQEERIDFLHNHIYPDSIMYSNNFEEGIEYQLFMNMTRMQKILSIRRVSKDQIKLANRVFLIEKDLISKNGVIHTVDGILT